MRQLLALLACGLLLGSTTSDDPTFSEDSCALFGGRCCNAAECADGYNMNNSERDLCGKDGNVCCNKFEETSRCTYRGGQCGFCEGRAPKLDTPDCTALGRQCCIYV